MGMSMHATGFRPPDERWAKMKAVYDAARVASIPIPHEVEEFFDGEEPDPAGVEVTVPTRKWKSDYQDGFELSVADIPEGCSVLRFYVSW